jgi:hypothetical protein
VPPVTWAYGWDELAAATRAQLCRPRADCHRRGQRSAARHPGASAWVPAAMHCCVCRHSVTRRAAQCSPRSAASKLFAQTTPQAAAPVALTRTRRSPRLTAVSAQGTRQVHRQASALGSSVRCCRRVSNRAVVLLKRGLSAFLSAPQPNGHQKPAVRRALEIDFGVEHRGFEPRTPCLPGKCSPAELMPRERKV